MPTRRTLFSTLLAALLFGSAASAETSPTDVLTSIYRRAAAGKGDGGGQFLWVQRTDRRAALTPSLAELWDRAEASTPAGDQGPLEFDPVTASQDPSLGGFRITAEEQTIDRARLRVSLTGRTDPAKPYGSVRYLLLRQNGRWLIDNITGSTGTFPWSLRALLQSHLAASGAPR